MPLPFSDGKTILETIERIMGATIGPNAAKNPPKNQTHIELFHANR